MARRTEALLSQLQGELAALESEVAKRDRQLADLQQERDALEAEAREMRQLIDHHGKAKL